VTVPEFRFSGGVLQVPDGWEARGDLDPFLVVLTPVGTSDRFVANINVVREVRGQGGASIDEHLLVLAESLADHRLVDRDELPVGGAATGTRLLSLHTTGGEGLVTEQWVTADAHALLVLSATCLVTEYDSYADPFGEVADSWRVDESVVP
jgi:hypothetical protein